jgi:two-component system, cell cycle sensor histidine kinase and response regulator CckA
MAKKKTPRKKRAAPTSAAVHDVVMPEMSGKELADQLQNLYPGLKVLFMFGYTANVIAHHGVLDAGVHFVQRPRSGRC